MRGSHVQEARRACVAQLAFYENVALARIPVDIVTQLAGLTSEPAQGSS